MRTNTNEGQKSPAPDSAKSLPRVELDCEADAAYVRWSESEIYRTEVTGESRCIVAIDYDKSNVPVAVEIIGLGNIGKRKA